MSEELPKCPDGCVHPEGTEYFVTIVRGNETRALLGPYKTHPEALANKLRGVNLANKADPWTCFDAFGTAALGPGNKSIFGV